MSSSSSRSSAVAVYCGSSLGNQNAFHNAASSLGTALARAGRRLVYGGGSKGIMGIVSGSTLEQGGEVTGVTPYAMYIAGGEREKTSNEIQNGIDVTVNMQGKERVKTIVVNSMHERKLEMARHAGGFVGLPGGFGTYEEVFEVVTWTQLAIHDKPVVLLNVLSFYSPLKELIRNGVKAGFIQPSNENLVVFVDGPSDQSQHETFNWGEAALNALDSWNGDTRPIYSYDWSKKMGIKGEVQADKLESA
ncbi:hypothetical protein DFH11DRAFT_1575108 [Phellopilus nigrolimitatus]|nr:hypothetical protein DFH11DRAFT_1575108 [Phellopilus nigrolimitatus]